ncbi:MAG: RNA polymerase sigma factor [Solirubrobacteraceae bacterium]
MDRQARFEQLYRDHAGAVRAYAVRRSPSESIVDDVVSDVFLVVWRRLDDVPGRPVPWLLAIARRTLANRWRSERRAAALTDRLAGLRRPVATWPERGDRLLDALATLPEPDRELLMLVAWEGLEPGEIGQLMGLRPGTVAVRLHRARRRLAVALSRQDLTAAIAQETR